MPTVQSVFSSSPPGAALCLECLVKQTTNRVEEIEHELDGLRGSLRIGFCWECAATGPVFGINTPTA